MSAVDEMAMTGVLLPRISAVVSRHERDLSECSQERYGLENPSGLALRLARIMVVASERPDYRERLITLMDRLKARR